MRGYLIEVIKEQGMTTMHFVPSMLRVFLQGREVGECRSLRRVISSGEELTPELEASYYERMEAGLYNLMGRQKRQWM